MYRNSLRCSTLSHHLHERWRMIPEGSLCILHLSFQINRETDLQQKDMIKTTEDMHQFSLRSSKAIQETEHHNCKRDADSNNFCRQWWMSSWTLSHFLLPMLMKLKDLHNNASGFQGMRQSYVDKYLLYGMSGKPALKTRFHNRDWHRKNSSEPRKTPMFLIQRRPRCVTCILKRNSTEWCQGVGG